MSLDDSDKTVFKQPAADGDRTVLRPMPGRRGAAPQPAAAPIGSPQAAPASPPLEQAQAAPPAHAPMPTSMDREASYFKTATGLNPLVNAASTLIAVFEKTRQSMSHPDIGGLHQRLVNELKAFETRTQGIGIQPEIALSARYLLCSALDEAVLNTPWGSESAWTQRTLLSVFHNETSGGEKFFLILDRMRQMPADNRDILELIYILLSLGFEGKYRVIHNGRETLEKLRDDLFSIIRSNRGEYERSLSPNWQGLGKISNTLAEFLPMWVIASIIAAIMFVSYSGFRVWLYRSAAPVADQLIEISEIKPATTRNGLNKP